MTIEVLPQRGDYVDQFEVYHPDSWAGEQTPEGLTAAMQLYDKGLCIGRHRTESFYAVLWRPTISFRGWSAPDIGEKPTVVWELRREWGDGRAFELGPWIKDKIIASDMWRGFKDKAHYAQQKMKERTAQLEAEERTQQARDAEVAEEIGSVYGTLSRAAHTIRKSADIGGEAHIGCSDIISKHEERRKVH